MTNEEAKMFLDNLKVCIDEHPVVADWLVEIANRKTEPQTIRCPKCGRSDYIREFGKDFSVTAEEAGFKYKCINCNTYIEPQSDRKTENSSEKPNNCEELNAYRECVKSRSFWDSKHCDGCYFDERCPFDEPETEPTISKMEQVDEPQKDAPILTAEEWAKIKIIMPESRLILFDDDGIAFEPHAERSRR